MVGLLPHPSFGYANPKSFGALGDGVTDDTTAFVASSASGLPIVITPGTYIINPIAIAQNMFGAGQGATILKAKAGTGLTTALITQLAASSATIRDLTIDGSNLCQYGIILPAQVAGVDLAQSGLRIETVEVKGVGNASSTPTNLPVGISVGNPTNLLLKQGIVITLCYIHDIFGDGVLAGGTGTIISNNTLVHTGSAGIGIFGQDISVVNNAIYDCGNLAGMEADGISGYDFRNLRTLVIGNTVNTSGNHGIHIGGNYIQILDNKIINPKNSGILLQSSPNAGPTPSTVGVISNNEINGPITAAGISVGFFSKVNVLGNNINNVLAAAGINYTSSADGIVLGNNITNCGAYGINFTNSDNGMVRCNRVDTTTLDAIRNNGSVNFRVSDNYLTNYGVTPNFDRYLLVENAGAITANVPDNTAVGGNARGASAVDLQMSRSLATQVASGANAFVAGNSNVASGAQSAAVGFGNTASGAQAFSSGSSNISSGILSFTAGNANTASGFLGASIGLRASDRGVTNKFSFASGRFISNGDAQTSWQILRGATTSVTPLVLTQDAGAASTLNCVNLPVNYAFLLEIKIVYRDTVTRAIATWTCVSALLSCAATVGTTTIAGATLVVGSISGAPGAAVPVITADTTNGGLTITVTAPNTDLSHWVAYVQSLETS